jgi:hypothetical protein
MDLEKFYNMAPKPRAKDRSLFNPADAKILEVKHTDFHSDIMLTTSDDGPVSLLTPELKVNKRMAVDNFDAMIEQIFDMV